MLSEVCPTELAPRVRVRILTIARWPAYFSGYSTRDGTDAFGVHPHRSRRFSVVAFDV